MSIIGAWEFDFPGLAGPRFETKAEEVGRSDSSVGKFVVVAASAAYPDFAAVRIIVGDDITLEFLAERP